MTLPKRPDKGLAAVTGANGTIGYSVVLYALRVGYNVRCIVRTQEAAEKITSGPSVHEHIDRIQFHIVPDNTVAGAYDEPLKDANYVIHIAGEWPKPTHHPDNDIYWPFVRSMENILSAASKHNTIRRIVFTQAGAGLMSVDDGELGASMSEVLNEHTQPHKHAAALTPPLTTPHHAYNSAKAYCMQHLLSLQHSRKLPFSIAQIIPGTVIGKSELVRSSEQAYAHMDRMSRALLFDEMRPRYAFGFVNVEDCAKVHVEALREDKVADEELPDFFVAAAPTEEGGTADSLWSKAADLVEERFGEEVKEGIFRVGRDKRPENMPFRVDSRLTERLLFDERQTFREFGENVKEVAEWYLGLLKKGGKIQM